MAAPQIVLVVDDDPAVRALTRILLSDEGYRILEASDGLEALQILRASGERLVVLLDLQMPGMNGWEVLGEIAADDELARRHVYAIVTGYRSESMAAADFAAIVARCDIPIIAKGDAQALLATVSRAKDRLRAAVTHDGEELLRRDRAAPYLDPVDEGSTRA